MILGGIQRQPREVFERAGWEEAPARLAIRASYEDAIVLARARIAEIEGTPAPQTAT